jgi:carbon-monoxide dehydrogenase medium subunit
MLLNLREYHRPAAEGNRQGLERALELLARPGIRTLPLAGGDTLLASADPTVEAVVDLQGLGLDVITEEGLSAGRLHVGAMVTRATLAAYFRNERRGSPRWIIGEGARRWGGSTQRNRATVGGALATAAADDPLVLVLLASAALVVLYSEKGTRLVPIADFLSQRAVLEPEAPPGLTTSALIIETIIPRWDDPAGAALEVVARTPADAPIVAAAAVLTCDGDRCAYGRLALGGVADVPLRLPEVEAMLAGQTLTADLIADAAARASALVHPSGDFRGSTEYRKAMARVLSERVLRTALGDLTTT